MSIITSLTYSLSAFFILIAVFAIIKSRFKKFTSKDFVLRFRSGKLMSQGYGGAYFVLPLIDELIVLNAGVNNLEIQTKELITLENLGVRISGMIIWRLEDPVKAYQSHSGSQPYDIMTQINKILEKLFESVIRTTVMDLTQEQVMRETSFIIDVLMNELDIVVSSMGVKVITVEICHLEFIDLNLRIKDTEKLNSIRPILRMRDGNNKNLETKTEGRKL